MIISPPISATIHRGSDQPIDKSYLQKPKVSSSSSSPKSRRPSHAHFQLPGGQWTSDIEANRIIEECAAYTKTPLPGAPVKTKSNENHDYDYLHADPYTPRPPPTISPPRSPTPSSPSSPTSKEAPPTPWVKENGGPQLTVPVVADESGSGQSTRPTSPSSAWPHHVSTLSLGSEKVQHWNTNASTAASVTWALPADDDSDEDLYLSRRQHTSRRPTGKTLVVYNTLSGDALLQQSKIARKMALMNKRGTPRDVQSTVFTDPVSGEAVDGDMLGLSYRPIPTEPSDADTRVPVILVLAFVATYLFVGAVLFNSLEGWNLLDATYFCFITLSTIGFGDFVPGESSLRYDDKIAQAKLVMSSLYLLLGLAVLAMSFSLVQEEVVIKCKQFAEFIGLMKD